MNKLWYCIELLEHKKETQKCSKFSSAKQTPRSWICARILLSAPSVRLNLHKKYISLDNKNIFSAADKCAWFLSMQSLILNSCWYCLFWMRRQRVCVGNYVCGIGSHNNTSSTEYCGGSRSCEIGL